MRRVFVESYPSAPDHGGAVALELGDRYLGEGMKAMRRMPKESLECFKAAEDRLPPFRPQGKPGGRGASQAHLCRGPLSRRLLEAAPGRARQACKKENARAHRRRASAIVVRMKARPPGLLGGMLPGFSETYVLHANRALANSAKVGSAYAAFDSPEGDVRACLGTQHATALDLAVSQWELWGDGRALVGDMHRLHRSVQAARASRASILGRDRPARSHRL